MKNLVYILSILAFFGVSKSSAQNLYCTLVDSALVEYQNKDMKKAKEYMEKALDKCPSAHSDAYAWHIMGFISRNYHKLYEAQDLSAPSREMAIKAFSNAMKFDQDGSFLPNNKKALNAIAISYYNQAAENLDTTNYIIARELYSKFKSTLKIVDPNYNFAPKDITFYNVMASVYKEKYENNRSHNKVFLDTALIYFENTLKLDEQNYSALYNVGVIYYNLGVEEILSLPDDASIEILIERQRNQEKYCRLALPYFERAYELDSNSKEIIEGFRGIWRSLNDDEKAKMYDQKLEEFDH